MFFQPPHLSSFIKCSSVTHRNRLSVSSIYSKKVISMHDIDTDASVERNRLPLDQADCLGFQELPQDLHVPTGFGTPCSDLSTLDDICINFVLYKCCYFILLLYDLREGHKPIILTLEQLQILLQSIKACTVLSLKVQ